ncbi:MAG: VanW family protein [Clostridia bacterium]|nr:VanW family protein [Clostridia bacterium]
MKRKLGTKSIFFTLIFLLFLPFLALPLSVLYADNEFITMSFTYENLTFTYTTKHLDYIDNFYLRSIAGKNGRLGAPSERADLLEKVLTLGVEPKIALQYVFKGLEKTLENMQQKIDCKPKNATMNFNPNISPYFVFEKEKIGYKINVEKLCFEIIENLRTSANFTIKLKPQVLNPEIFYNDLKDFSNLRSSFFTSFNEDNVNRKHNIALAMKKFNGMKIERGNEYSFNNTTGRRSDANGYLPANIIVDKKYVEGFGGGVCQASTTLYNALLLAGMDFREVHSHSLVSSYVNMGFDAMVNYGTSDLRWVNNTNTDMFVRTYVEGNRVGVQIFGKPENPCYTYKRVTEVEKEIAPPADEVIVDVDGEYCDLVNFSDESAYINLPHKGYKVRAILEKYDGENLVERKFLRRVNYHATRGVKVVGVKERPASIVEEKTVPQVYLDKKTVDFWKNYNYY